MGGPMAIGAPQGRNHLFADALVRLVRSGGTNVPDDRGGDPAMALTEALMSAFARFSLPSPALLAFETPRVEGHVGTLDGIGRVPCDTPRRARRDPVSPAWLRLLCPRVFRPLQRGKARASMECRDGHS